MSMYNFYVKVLSKENQHVRCLLKIIWSEQHEFYSENNFALQLIRSKENINAKKYTI